MKNIKNMKFEELMDLKDYLESQIMSAKDENARDMLKANMSNVIDELKFKNNVYETINPETEEEIKEKKSYEEHSDYIKGLSMEDFDEEIILEEKEEKKSKFKRRAMKAGVVGAIVLSSAIALSQCNKKSDTKNDTAVETTVPENTPSNTSSVIEKVESTQDETDTQKAEIEEAAINYFNEYEDSLNKNFDGKQISEQDIINIAYLINDREDLLSSEALTDACDNIENGVGYESSKFLSITSLLENKATAKQMLSKSEYREWKDKFNKTVNSFKPAKLSKLIVKNDENMQNIKQIEEGIDTLYNSIKKHGVITKDAKERYNDLLVRLHHNNAYKNYSAVSNDTENNDNLGFKYFMNAASYAAYDIGTTINPKKEVVKSSNLTDPITGKKFDVKLTTHNNHELDVINRVSKGENTKKLIHEYTKIRNELVVLGYKDDLCSDRIRLEKQVKQNEKSKKSNKILSYK